MTDEIILAWSRKKLFTALPTSIGSKAFGYDLEAEHIVHAGTIIGHPTQDGCHYIACFEAYYNGVKQYEETDMLYKPNKHQLQLIFGPGVYVTPETMPESITIYANSLEEAIPKGLKMMDKSARAIMINAPDDLGASDYAKCRIWRITPIWKQNI